MTDILAKIVIVILALICAGGAKYALQNKSFNKSEQVAIESVEKVAEEVIKEETGFNVDLAQIVDGSHD